MIHYILHALSVLLLIKEVGLLIESAEPVIRLVGVVITVGASYSSYFFLRLAIAYSRNRAKKLADSLEENNDSAA